MQKLHMHALSLRRRLCSGVYWDVFTLGCAWHVWRAHVYTVYVLCVCAAEWAEDKNKKKCHKGLTPAAGTSMSSCRCHCRLWALISQQVLSISFMIYLHFWLLTQLGQCLIWDGWKPHPNLNQRHFPQTHLSWPEMWWDCCQGDFMATRQVWTESRQSGLKTALWL